MARSKRARKERPGRTSCSKVCHTNCRSKSNGRFVRCTNGRRGTQYCTRLLRATNSRRFMRPC